MKPRLRRFTAFAAFAVVFTLASPVHADERGGSFRAFWTALWTWFTPLTATATAPRLDVAVLRNGVAIDPYGRGSASPPPGAAAGSTAENPADPSG